MLWLAIDTSCAIFDVYMIVVYVPVGTVQLKGYNFPGIVLLVVESFCYDNVNCVIEFIVKPTNETIITHQSESTILYQQFV